MIRVTLDWETAYGKHPVTQENITLSKMTTEHYVRHPHFKAHGLGIKIDNDRAFYLYERDDLTHFLRTHPWGKTFAIGHHSHFDMAILSWRCGIRPAFIGDTLSMARAVFPNESHSLARLAKLLGLGEKGTELANFQGKWTLTDAEQQIMGRYCCNDVELTAMIFDKLRSHFPLSELRLIDWTVRAFTEPVLVVNRPPLIEAYKAERRRKRALIKQCNTDKRVLASNDQFASLLLTLGVDPPKKLSPSKVKDGRVDPDAVGDPPNGLLPSFKVHKGVTAEERAALKEEKNAYPWAYAFGKSDEEFKQLLDHPDAQIQAVVEARLGVKSTIKETRSKRFFKIGKRGRFPVYLNYYGAHSGRWSAGDAQNAQNLPRVTGEDISTDALRLSLCAPEGHVVVVRDSGQIECLCEDTFILTFARGYVKIQEILKSDLLWDGEEWVPHDGVVCTGYREVIEYEGLRATPDHRVYLSSGGSSLFLEAAVAKSKIAIGEFAGNPIRFVAGTKQADTSWNKRNSTLVPVPSSRMRKRTSSAASGFTKRQIYKLRHPCARKRILCVRTKSSSCRSSSTVQSNTGGYKPHQHQSSICCIPTVWDKKQIRVCGAICPIHARKPSPRIISGGRDRSNRQCRALRARKYSSRYEGGECPEQIMQPNGFVERGAHERNQVRKRGEAPVSSLYRFGYVKERSYPGADNTSPNHSTAGGNFKQIGIRPVYDILNCGPRHRFTANGKIVSNCRVLVYAAGQEDMLGMFRQGGDPYDFMASKIYNRPVDRKRVEADKNPGQVGKIIVLGAGYQMGAWKLQENVRVGFMGMKGFLFDQTYVDQLGVDIETFMYQRAYKPGFSFNYEVAEACRPMNVSSEAHLTHCAVTKHLIDTFRRENPQVVALWKECQEALKLILAGVEAPVGANGLISTCAEGFLLPNGMKIRYDRLRLSSDGKEYKYLANVRKKEWTKIYAGKAVENLVQALARIVVLSDQKLRVIDRLRDYPLRKGEVAKVVSSTHDEIISVVPYRYAEDCLSMMNEEMRRAPAWCPDLPLKSSGGYAVSYGECEK